MQIKALDQVQILDRATVYHGDTVDLIRGLPSNSIDLTVTSLPFANVYLYSDSPHDMGNTDDDRHFFEHFDYLIPELFRVTTPGRLAVIHCKDLPLYKGSDGVAGLRDFPGEIRRRFCGEAIEYLQARLEAFTEAKALIGRDRVEGLDEKILEVEDELLEVQRSSWVFHSRVTIWKCPKIEMERTNNHGLLHNQLCKDSSVSRQGMADYLLVFRKWCDEMDGLNSPKPVTRLNCGGKYRFDSTPYVGTELPETNPDRDPRGHSIRVWQKYASPVWFDIKQTNVLKVKKVKSDSEERHMCCLQLDVIDRCIDLWSNPGDVIFDPFSGWGSTGVEALKMGRNYVGCELNPRYFKQSIAFLEDAASAHQIKLEDQIETELASVA
ncbi:MAG TPA: site-specific DNA-methyltransferase [Coleofasciculaceae cyanobacterium]